MNWTDQQAYYGLVSRSFHWGMALLLGWQFAGALSRKFFEDTALEGFFWSTHRSVGVVVFALVILRGVWALAQRSHRPASVHWLALTGQITLYLLTFLVPLIALLRQYGSGRAFEPFGIPVFSGWPGEGINWMVALGGLLHGELAYVLLALILGHVGMAVWHRQSSSQLDVLPRMWGRVD